MRDADPAAPSEPNTTWTMTARWLFPVAGEPVRNGVVVIRGQRIAAVEPLGRRTADIDLGNAALLPGLVNAHTHLDLTGLRGQVPPSADFTGWLRAVVGHRRGRPPIDVLDDIRAGLAECIRHGTTLVGDIAAGGSSAAVLAEAPIRSVVFHELLGLPRARAEQSLAAVRDWLATFPSSDVCRPGLSPHAPYSVHRWLFTAACQLAAREAIPLATHLAESNAELELLRQRRGPFVEFLTQLGVWDEEGLVHGPEEMMAICEAEGVPALLIHGNYLDETAVLPASGTVVLCPRTHAAFRHGPHPFRAFLQRGVRVALGTDSLASNPDLDILVEARFLRRNYPDVSGAALLSMLTLSGAEALGLGAETGSLETGKSADLVVLPLADDEPADPHELIFNAETPVQAVLCRGAWIHGNVLKTTGN